MRILSVLTASFIVWLFAASSGHPAFAQQVSSKLFDAIPTFSTGPGTSPEQATVFASLTRQIALPQGWVALISSTPDGKGPIVIDNFMNINGRNICEGVAGQAFLESCFGRVIKDPEDPGVVGLPIETVLTPIPPIDVSSRFAAFGGFPGSVTFELRDFGFIAGNTDLYLVFTPPTVALRALEVNQSIQTWRNDVRLLANKFTAVRAFVEAKPGASSFERVDGRLSVTRDGIPLGTILAINPGSSVNVGQDVVSRRGSLFDSLNFELPMNWVQLKPGTATAVLQLKFDDASGLPIECQEPPDAIGIPTKDCAVRVIVDKPVEPKIVFVGVPYKTSVFGAPVAPTNPELFEQMLRVRFMLPISSIDFQLATLGKTYFGKPDLDTVISDLRLKKDYDTYSWCKLPPPAPGSPPSICPPNPETRGAVYYGVLSGNGGGKAWVIGGDLAAGFLNGASATASIGSARSLASHELGHVFAQQHAVDHKLGLVSAGFLGLGKLSQGYCGELAHAEAPDHFPFATLGGKVRPVLGRLDLGPDEEVWGLDNRFVNMNPSSLAVVDPRRIFELMSYCGVPEGQGKWISKKTYNNIYNRLKGIFPGAAQSGGAILGSSAAPDEFVVVRGLIDPLTGLATLAPLNELTGIAPPPPVPGSYRVQLLDASGNELAGADFEPEVEFVDPETPETPAAPPRGQISVSLMKPAAMIARVVVLNRGVVIGEQLASNTAPTVTILSPVGGESLTEDSVTFAWMGTDADGDALTYSVLYSHNDGTTWSTLAVDIPDTTLTISRSELQAAMAARLLVVASDGVHTANALSELFAVANNGPLATIDRPGNGNLFTGEQMIAMEGAAFDREEGRLSGDAVEWFSNRDGFLGNGESLSVNAATLSEGRHQLTFVATDTESAVGSDTVRIRILRVAPPPLPCDINSDGVVDRNDIDAILAALNVTSGLNDPHDADSDGTITVNDARICKPRCTEPDCEPHTD